MCGIVGWAFSSKCRLTARQRTKLLQYGAFGADKRGGQSWGVLTLDGSTPEVTKGLGALVRRNFKRLARHPFGFAHSRYATHGKVTLENCHPFEVSGGATEIIGAHNGVLSNATELDRLFGAEEVDSVHIFKRLAAGEKLDKLEGYGVIEFYDKRFASTLMLANIGRGSVTLWELPDGGGYFWCSLKDDGELALESNGVDAKEVSMSEGAVYAFHRDRAVYRTDQELKLGENRWGAGFLSGGAGFHSSDYKQPWRGKSTYHPETQEWDDDTGEFPTLVEAALGMTREEKAELREEMLASWAEGREGAVVEKEWTIGAKEVDEKEVAGEKSGILSTVVKLVVGGV